MFFRRLADAFEQGSSPRWSSARPARGRCGRRWCRGGCGVAARGGSGRPRSGLAPLRLGAPSPADLGVRRLPARCQIRGPCARIWWGRAARLLWSTGVARRSVGSGRQRCDPAFRPDLAGGLGGAFVEAGNEQRRQDKINLKGYLVGNPITGLRFDDFNSRIPYGHGVGIISDQLYEAAMENCEGNYVSPMNKMCALVINTIENLISQLYEEYILGDKCVHDAPKPVKNDSSRSRFLSEEQFQLRESSPHPTINCFNYRYYLSNIWANDQRTRDALRIKKGTIGTWVRCIKGFPYAHDIPSSLEYQFNLTTRGYRALVFSGDHDMVVPHLGTQAWIRSFNFSIVDNWRAWHVDGQSAGFTTGYANHMTFATIKGGGHTAISFRPKQGFAMGQRWLENEPL